MKNSNSSSTTGNYRKGLAPLLILALLRQQDMYGYQLVLELEKQTDGIYTLQEGSLYPVLYKLVDQGHISDRKELVGRRMTRVYYHIEPSGLKLLDELIKEYNETVAAVRSVLGN